jgi:hypothetical protein
MQTIFDGYINKKNQEISSMNDSITNEMKTYNNFQATTSFQRDEIMNTFLHYYMK